MANYYIHLGLPRAASTFFQREVFSKIPGFSYLGPEITQYHPDFQKMMYQDDSLFEGDAIPTSVKNLSEENVILSNELFVGQSIFMASTNRSRNAQRLKSWFPDATILLVLRNQSDLLRSLYSISVYDFNNLKPEDFIRFPDDLNKAFPANKDQSLYKTFLPVEHAENYLYEPLVRLYKTHFKNVRILLFEDLIRTPELFLQQLSSGLNADLDIKTIIENFNNPKVNSSLSSGKLSSLRNWNKFSPLLSDYEIGNRIYQKGKQFIEHNFPEGKSLKFQVELEEKIKSYYREDNAALLKANPELEINRYFDNYF